jgi:hypothetical protein
MSHEAKTPPDAAVSEANPASEDPRRDWVTPTVAELPIASTQGTATPTGTDFGFYS